MGPNPTAGGGDDAALVAGALALGDMTKIAHKYAEELSWKRHNRFACQFWLNSEDACIQSAVIKCAYDAIWEVVFKGKLDEGGWALAPAGDARDQIYCRARTETCNRVTGPGLMYRPDFIKTREEAEAKFFKVVTVMRRRMEYGRLLARRAGVTKDVGGKIASYLGLVYHEGDEHVYPDLVKVAPAFVNDWGFYSDDDAADDDMSVC